VRDLSWEEDISSWTENSLLSVADEGVFAVEDVEGLVLFVVQVVGRGVA
jgi:hypothetical protein